MSIRFEWHFDDEEGQKTEKEAARATRLSSWIASLLARVRARFERRPLAMGLTASQRRLHAALARTRPWLCPDALPELAAPSLRLPSFL